MIIRAVAGYFLHLVMQITLKCNYTDVHGRAGVNGLCRPVQMSLCVCMSMSVVLCLLDDHRQCVTVSVHQIYTTFPEAWPLALAYQ